MTAAPLDLRALVAEMVREVVADTVTEMVGGAVGDSLGGTSGPASALPPPAAPVDDAPRVAGAQHVTPPDLRTRAETVRLVDDADLDAFVRRLLILFENPKNRQDLKAGRLRFHLGRAPATGAAPAGAAVRVETGAVTERQVKAAAEAGRRLVLGRRAVLTPLAREKARALGVPIEKER